MRHRAMGQATYRRAVAKDHDLARVFHHLKPAPMDFSHEPLHPGKAFHIAPLAADHATLLDGFGLEQVVEPDVG
ncbi:MAG: hypothetical protein ACU0AZ_11355 [Paracoccaceae bacterium]